MTSQDNSAKLMEDLIAAMNYLRPSLDALQKVLSEGNQHAMEKQMALQGLLDRIHITMELFARDIGTFLKAEEERLAFQKALQLQQQTVEQVVATLNQRLQASEENSKRLEALILNLIQLLR